MFDRLKGFRCVIVTGPHRSGTTIAAEMIAADTGKRCVREEEFRWRNIIKAAEIRRGVIQGPYLLPWTPVLADDETMVVYVRRDGAAIDASVRRLRVSKPHFHWRQAWELWRRIAPLLPHTETIEYEALREHRLWVEDRRGWTHRQTSRSAAC